jgi:putative tryptophan/tyrosine transport system substrate-binding protein
MQLLDHLKRREFIALLGGAAAWPIAARAQLGERMRRIGALMATAEDDPETKLRLVGLRQGLEKLGWFEGRNIQLDTRFAPAPNEEQATVLAKEIVALRPDVILAQSTPITAAFQRETRAIPIVFVFVNDPIGSGFIANLARPGGNLTGLTLFEAGIAGKWLSMLKEIAPRLSRAGFMFNPKTTSFAHYVPDTEALATSLAIELIRSPVENAADIERTIESLARLPNTGLVLPSDATTVVHRNLIIGLAARYRLPAVYPFRLFAAAGGLMSYGIDFVDVFRQSAFYVDGILRGDKPADLPVQTPTKYETVVNLKTAKALELTVPPGLLVAADEIIE